MNSQSKIIVVLVLLTAGFIFAFGYQRGKSKQAAKDLETITSQKEVQVTDLEVKLKGLRLEVEDLTKKATEASENASKLFSDLRAERLAAKREREAKAATAPPETIVAETRRLLNTEEVWLIETKIVMTEAASRINLEKLLSEENMREVEMPMNSEAVAYLVESNELCKEALAKAVTLDTVNQSMQVIKTEIIKDFKTYAKDIKKSSWKDYAISFLGGLVAGGGIALLAH